MNFNVLDVVVRMVPRRGYLPLIVGHDRETGKTNELYRGEFKATALDALTNAQEMLDQVMSCEDSDFMDRFNEARKKFEQRIAGRTA